MSQTGKAIVGGTLLSGTLDLLSAFAFSAMNGATPDRVMAGVAAGPFGDAVREQGAAAVLLGTAVHYTIMTIMVSVFVLAARRLPALRRQWIAAGIVYGVLLYLLMYWLVLPMRWPAIHPRTDLWTIGNALFSHIICVGLPMAWWTRRTLGRVA